MIANRLLIVGAGDIAQRALPSLRTRYQVHAMARTPERAAELGPCAFTADLDHPAGLRLPETDCVLHAAPPVGEGEQDTRTRTLLATLDKAKKAPGRIVYISTSGVYGDCHGAWVDESRPVQPQTARARRRVDAEQQLTAWCAARSVALVILRAPGIYAPDRLPLARIRQGIPVLLPGDDVYTNHIHADDLAALCARALHEDALPGVYNAADDSQIRMGDWMDALADRFGLPRPPRIARAGAESRISPGLLSFLDESRRLSNVRLKNQLKYTLRYPTVLHGLAAMRPAAEAS